MRAGAAVVAVSVCLAVAGCTEASRPAAPTTGAATSGSSPTSPTLRVPVDLPAGAQLDRAAAGVWAITGTDPHTAIVVRLSPAPSGASATLDSGALVVFGLPATGSPTVETTKRLVTSATWVAPGGTRSLVVTPSWAARAWRDAAGQDVLWAQLTSLVPTADTPGMRDQLVCHVLFAPTKATWNLEPARPAVGLPQTIAAGCNPGAVADSG